MIKGSIQGEDIAIINRTSLVAQTVKNSPAMRETWVQSLGWKDPLAYMKTKALIASLMAQLVKNLPAMRETWI